MRASVQNDRAMLITAKRPGETNLIGLDVNGVDFFHAVVIVGGGELGRIQFHSRARIQEYWTYRCTSSRCSELKIGSNILHRPHRSLCSRLHRCNPLPPPDRDAGEYGRTTAAADDRAIAARHRSRGANA